ncbi:GNAT family N-acetyltransferase [Chryseobacterium sp. R2A-55]|uniref:GNAT family N-acetyltransferase n=1 Tax=Chryseobacterium sp. R2A-55 TaxID=2744445 RepID=UPI001F2921DD|nr:GNAT family N-acetyltransferase [Chryseobacterium sp. R2A-55]
MDILWKIKSFEQLTTEELYKIMKARIEVFVVEQNCPYPELDGFDGKAVHIWGELQDELVAYCRIFDRGVKYREASVGRVLTALKYRNLNLGKTVMTFAINAIENRFRTHEIRISAQDYLLRFYTGFGFRDTGKKYLEDDIPHTEMVKIPFHP